MSKPASLGLFWFHSAASDIIAAFCQRRSWIKLLAEREANHLAIAVRWTSAKTSIVLWASQSEISLVGETFGRLVQRDNHYVADPGRDYEIYRHTSAIKCLVLILNIAVAVYLLNRMRNERPAMRSSSRRSRIREVTEPCFPLLRVARSQRMYTGGDILFATPGGG